MSKENAKKLSKLLMEMLYAEHGGKEQFKAWWIEQSNKPNHYLAKGNQCGKTYEPIATHGEDDEQATEEETTRNKQ